MKLACLALLIASVLATSQAYPYGFHSKGVAYVPNAAVDNGTLVPYPVRVGYRNKDRRIKAKVSSDDVMNFIGVIWGDKDEDGEPDNEVGKDERVRWMDDIERIILEGAMTLDGFHSYAVENRWANTTAHGWKVFTSDWLKYNETDEGKEKKYVLSGVEAREWMEEKANDKESWTERKYLLQAVEAVQRIAMPSLMLADCLGEIYKYKETAGEGRTPAENSPAGVFETVPGVTGGYNRQYMFRVPNDKGKYYTREKWNYAKLGALSDAKIDTALAKLYTPVTAITLNVDPWTYELAGFSLYSTPQQQGDRRPFSQRVSESDLLVRYEVKEQRPLTEQDNNKP